MVGQSNRWYDVLQWTSSVVMSHLRQSNRPSSPPIRITTRSTPRVGRLRQRRAVNGVKWPLNGGQEATWTENRERLGKWAATSRCALTKWPSVGVPIKGIRILKCLVESWISSIVPHWPSSLRCTTKYPGVSDCISTVLNICVWRVVGYRSRHGVWLNRSTKATQNAGSVRCKTGFGHGSKHPSFLPWYGMPNIH